MSIIYKFFKEQVVATDMATAWEFISTPKNLEALTPDDLPFEIITELPDAMYNGLLMEYRIGLPLIGKQTWLTEIKHVREQHSFVDEQRSGPYTFWYHYHAIRPVPKGVCFVDQVHYGLPGGPLGSLVDKLYVRKKLHYIFDYRARTLPKLLNGT